MLGLDPRLIALFCIMFIALGIFNVLTGRRRMMQARLQGQSVAWYKQISILTGIEYVLLACAFLLNIGITYHWLPTSLTPFVLPFYLVILLASGLLAGVVIYQGITSSRRRGGTVQVRQGTTTSVKTAKVYDTMTPEERTEHLQKRRERRQKAAAARRRRAGKA